MITDHNVRDILDITDRAYIISEGRIFASGTPEEITSNPDVRRSYLGEHFELSGKRLHTKTAAGEETRS